MLVNDESASQGESDRTAPFVQSDQATAALSGKTFNENYCKLQSISASIEAVCRKTLIPEAQSSAAKIR